MGRVSAFKLMCEEGRRGGPWRGGYMMLRFHDCDFVYEGDLRGRAQASKRDVYFR